MSWDPTQYLRFADARLRPGLELLARIDHDDPHRIHDVGCGTGTLTRVLRERWPDAEITASDTSVEMLDRARDTVPDVEWQLDDVRSWNPPHPLDIIYSNAVLHWVDEQDDVMLRLLRSLNPGGVLAVQMPLSWGEASHQVFRELLERNKMGSPELRAEYARRPVADQEHYYELLRNEASEIDIWSTRYLQVMSGPDPVFEWVKGTLLRPLLEEVAVDDVAPFLAAFRSELSARYPAYPNGDTLYAVPRQFIVATR